MNHVYALPLLLLSLWNPLAATAQGPAYLPGEVLVMLKPGEVAQYVADDLQLLNGQRTGLEVAQEVSAPMRTWLLRFDATVMEQQMVLRAVSAHPAVMLAQNNHVVTERQVPNDTQYGQQWHHQNINSEAAWEVSTGGVTATGDSIVVCIIETADLPHADLTANAWRNMGEVADNNIDDDQNGYVDDRLGWNPPGNNDAVFGGAHGTQVAGMIGAKGNNASGVAGANWNVKMMVVNYGGTSESQVVAAYTYPLVMRRLYASTGGEKGAFVVATNASWGINNGQPADSPLWCAVYDSLGTVGILSCGATSNSNVDIDVVGDLPTGCASDFMVSVTATDINDERTFSAYGATMVDVGAPGDDVLTTSIGGGFGTTSGTSFASPLTAGVIGLLYSAPCASLMALVDADPAAGALYVRDKLFEGVDEVGNLPGQTLTGGRINAGSSMQLIMNNCGACPGAYALSATSPELATSILSWNSPTASTFDVRHRAVGATDWTEVSGLGTNSLQLNGLDLCTAHEFQVRPLCEGEESDYGTSFVWTSEGCCTAPLNVMPGFVGENIANVSWGTVLVAEEYTVRYRVQGSTTWSELTGFTGNSAEIPGLEPCTAYEVQVTSSCNGVGAEWSPSVDLTTLGCGWCVDNAYCPSSSDDSSSEWIAGVSFAGLNNTSGDDDGYGDYTGQATLLVAGNSYPITLTPGFSFIAFSEAWRVYLDADQDGQFAETEVVFATPTASNAVVNGTMNVPADALPGVTRLRVVMSYQNPVTEACGGFDYGETEDYCVELQGTVGVQDLANERVVSVFPSPADRTIFFDLTEVVNGPLTITVLDESGRVVARKPLQNGRATLTTADLADGLYIYRITGTDREVATGRFMVSHLW
jgi:hypothetical protein